MAPIGLPSRISGTASEAAEAARSVCGPHLVVGVLEHVRNRRRSRASGSRVARRCPPRRAASGMPARIAAAASVSGSPMAARWISVAVEREDARDVRPAQRQRAAAIVSNTGWTSVGDRLMTRRMSLVAVCCSSASVRSRLRASSSVNRRTFSMAMTAWSAKVLQQRDLRVRKRSAARAADGDGADRLAVAHQRHGKHAAEAGRAAALRRDSRSPGRPDVRDDARPRRSGRARVRRSRVLGGLG